MSKLVVTAFVTLDGVVQAPGAPGEDPSGGFDHGGWQVPFFDDATGAFIGEVFERAGCFLLGRKTYDIFAGFWPNITDEGNVIATRLNSLPKYVASRSLDTATWQHSTLIQDVPAEVMALKEQSGGELQVHGSADLIQTLIEHDLVDAYTVLTVPEVLGTGKRLFPEGVRPGALRLKESQTTSKGVTISSYEHAGKPTYGAVGLDT
jgi:dihydrofolate reductase